jgi:hypothetical protein
VNTSSNCTTGSTFTPSAAVPGPRTADLSVASPTKPTSRT